MLIFGYSPSILQLQPLMAWINIYSILMHFNWNKQALSVRGALNVWNNVKEFRNPIIQKIN